MGSGIGLKVSKKSFEYRTRILTKCKEETRNSDRQQMRGKAKAQLERFPWMTWREAWQGLSC